MAGRPVTPSAASSRARARSRSPSGRPRPRVDTWPGPAPGPRPGPGPGRPPRAASLSASLFMDVLSVGAFLPWAPCPGEVRRPSALPGATSRAGALLIRGRAGSFRILLHDRRSRRGRAAVVVSGERLEPAGALFAAAPVGLAVVDASLRLVVVDVSARAAAARSATDAARGRLALLEGASDALGKSLEIGETMQALVDLT